MAQMPLASHTMLVPQLVPAGLLPMARQTGVPVEHEMAPVWQASLGWQEVPAVHAAQVPFRQTPVAHWVPLGVPAQLFEARGTKRTLSIK